MMNFPDANRNRLYASLLILGAGILLYRTISMVFHGALTILVLWVSALLLLELVIDLLCIVFSMWWWWNQGAGRWPLRFGAMATVLHALRVLIFVLGRTGPLENFDVRPEHAVSHAERWTWGQVYFAATLSILGVIGLLVIWLFVRKARRRSKNDPKI